MRFLGPAVIAALVLAVNAFRAFAAPKAKLWERWEAHDAGSTAEIDHGGWDRFLKTHVTRHPDGVNRIAYARVGDAGRRALDDYVAGLAAVPISGYPRAAQLAYWINLYNALTVRLVLERYPVKSILDISISPGWFAIGPWGKKLVTVEGEGLTLDDIEHRILRPIWRDPRIHYAVSCASIGCPNLAGEAFTAANADALLDRAARAYVNSARGVEATDRGLVVSSLYKWYREDFGGSEEGVIDHLRRYAGPDLAAALAGSARIAGHRYDWALNDSPSAPAPE